MSCPISAKIFSVWTQIPRIFSKTKKQLSFRGKNVVSIFRSRHFLYKYFLCMLIGIKILSSVSLESLFPVKHNHFVWWLIWQWSIEWGPQCQRGGTKLCHTDIFPYNSFFFSKSTSFYRWGAIYPSSSDHVDLQAKQKFAQECSLLPLMKIVRFDFISPWKVLSKLFQ